MTVTHFAGAEMAGKIGMAASDSDTPYLFMDDIFFTGEVYIEFIPNHIKYAGSLLVTSYINLE